MVTCALADPSSAISTSEYWMMTFNEIINQRNSARAAVPLCSGATLRNDNPEETISTRCCTTSSWPALAVSDAAHQPGHAGRLMLAMVALPTPAGRMFVCPGVDARRYVFTRCQLRGYYPSYVLNEWERRRLQHQGWRRRRADPAKVPAPIWSATR